MRFMAVSEVLMRLIKFLFFTVALGGLPSLASASSDPFDAVATSQMDVSDIPGAAIAIIERGRVTKLKTFGIANVEWSQAVTPDTRFQLASATKIFTGILLMRLVERGAVSLDDPLTRWFPEAPTTWKSIRVRQLANHTSGLSEKLGTPRPQTVDGIVAAAMAVPLAYEPGNEACYGFTDFTVLRVILEKASGLTLPDLLAQEIARPLGLRSTSFAMANDDGTVGTAAVMPQKATIYGLRDGKLVTSDFFYAPQGYGAGGLYSSINDLAALFVALDQGRLLKKSSLIALETPARLPDGRKSGFGVGWVARTHRGVPIVGHSGGPALADIIRVEDRQLTIIALTNQQTFYPLIAEAILDGYLPSPPTEAVAPDDMPMLTSNLKAVFSASANGEVVKLFSAEGSAALEQLRSPFAQAMLRGMGPVKAIAYLGAGPQGRRYRVEFARRTMIWLAAGDANGRIASLMPE